MKKILVIDDQENNRITISKSILNNIKDVEVITAADGKNGIDLAKNVYPDTIILDIVMPDMDGFEVCQILKNDEFTKHIPIIMLTSLNSDINTKSKGLALGADAFLGSPIEPLELAMQIKVMLRIKTAEDVLRKEKLEYKKIAEDKTNDLIESNIKYQTLYNEAPLPYQSLNNEGVLIDVNPAWLKILGYERSEVIGRNFSYFLHKNDKINFPSKFKEFKKKGHVEGVEFKIKHRDGNYRDISFNGNIGYQSDGHVKQTYCVFHDITENKISKQELKESQEYYKALIENSADYINIIDANGFIKSLGDINSSILGYSSEEIMGSSIFTLVHPEDKERLIDSLSKLVNENNLLENVSFRFKHKDGTWRFMEGTGKNMLNHDKIKGIVINYRDNSDKLKIEKEKTESQRKLQTLINNLQGIAYICKVDKYWTMEYLSAGFEAITGYPISDIINNNLLSYADLIHEEDKDYVTKVILEAIENGKSFSIQYRLKHKNGNNIYVLEKGLGIINPDDGSISIEGFINDISSTKLAEKELNKLNSVVKQSLSQIVITDPYGVIEYVNPKFTETTGYSSTESVGQKSNILKSGEQSSEIYTSLWKTISEGKIWSGEFHNKKKNGELFWEYATISPIVDNKGSIINYFKIGDDITHKKLAETALQESEHRYKKLIETSAEGFWLIGKNGITKEVNQSLCNIIGYAREEILGKAPYDFVDNENEKIFRLQIARANSDMQRKYEICLRTKSGINVATRFIATSISDNEGNFQGSFAFVSDISESKKAEKIQKVLYNISNAISKSENLNTLISRIQTELSTIIDTTNFFIALYDKNTNNLTLPFFTDEKDKIVTLPAGKSLTDYVIKTEKPLLANQELKEKLEREGKIERYGSNSKIWLGVPLKFNNEVIGVLVVQSYKDENAFDKNDMKMLEFVSDQVSISINRKKNEDKIVEALEKAKESDRLKTAFLQNISHEIRTPMNGILGFTSLLKDQDLSDVDQQSYLDVIMVSSFRMLNTLNDIMDISMLETGQVNLNICNTNINNELNSLYDLFKLEVEKKGLNIEHNAALQDQKIVIETDRDKFYAIFSNLIKNAIKYTSKGNITYGYNIVNNEIEFFVNDTGIGIPEHRIAAIFDSFVQADIEDVKVHEGSGLGLSISKAYIELMGGRIWVESVYGEGSIFKFTLPYNKVEEDQIEITDKSESKLSKNVKILIAEDEEFASEYLSILLEGPNTELLYAYDGEAAVSMCRQHSDLNLVLMDIKLPKLNGYDATKAIRTFNSDIIIIAQTAYALAGDKEKALSAGCNDYITKPINREKLLQIIDKYI